MTLIGVADAYEVVFKRGVLPWVNKTDSQLEQET